MADLDVCLSCILILIMYLQKDACTFHKDSRGSQFRRTTACTDRIWSRPKMVFNNETSA